MNKFLKKVVSGFTSLSICTSLMMGVPAVADENDGIQTQAQTASTLSIDFLGRGANPADTSQGDAMLKKADVNNEFWVGVSVDNISGVSLFESGIYSLDIAFEYNPNYVKPYWNSSDAEGDWKAEVEKGNLSATGDVAAWWDSSCFDVTSVYECDIDTVGNDRENATEASQRVADGWKMCYVGITLKDGLTPNYLRFMVSATTTKYLIKLPFTLVGVPAENDPDQNPTVLSLVRGKDTFAIGSGNGTNPYASWYATERPAPDDTNLKNLFTFKGDISLFGQGGAIENIVPVKPAKTQDEQDTSYTLSQTLNLGEEGFEAEKTTYYLSVPNETEEICLDITSSVLPTVTANNASINVNTGDAAKEYRTDTFPLAELDKDTNGGFNNTVIVSAGSKQYEIYIRRLLKPQIKLNYGNSPVGMIMSDDTKYPTETDKNTAIQQFKSTREFDDVNAGMIYYEEAWRSYKAKTSDEVDYNGDDDPTAIFIYQRRNFKEPGFVAYDSLGDEITATVKSKLSVIAYVGGMPAYDSRDAPEEVTEEAVGTGHIYTKVNNINIRPDVYSLVYQFEDPYTSEIVTTERKVIGITKLGDARIDANDIVNNLDASLVKSNSNLINLSNSLYTFRICDAKFDANKIVNNLDASKIKTYSTQLPLFYEALPMQ